VSDQQWIDKFAIQELIYRHCDAITRGDLAALEPLYAPDASWEHSLLGVRFDSARAFFDFFAKGLATIDLVIQTASNPVVRLVDDKTAHATTTVFEVNHGTLAATADGYGTQGDEVNVAQWGVYFDDLSKSTGQWLFTRRHMVISYVEQRALRGDVLAPRPLAP
jgi:ketosteroid isomerase-like protein